ncbi:tellurite resistance TerB family protein [Dongia sp.]|uniref:tellurite resistance TerB family protein n=1 Tax=Dongia sp. TaxID=1977262 RepID=UPI0035B39480
MLDPKRLLEDFLGGNVGQGAGQGSGQGFGKAGTFAAGAATGGLVGLLLGSKKAKKIGGNLLGYGGAAVLGGLAYKAWQNYQAKSQTGGAPASIPYPTSVPASGAPAALPLPADSPFDPGIGTSADGKPFALALVRAMIAAAKADGHMDANEQSQLFARIEELQLDADAKAFVFDELGRPTNLDAIAALPRSQEQAAEIWLASRLAIDPDDVREKAYMSALAAKLRLPPELLNQLERQASAVPAEMA